MFFIITIIIFYFNIFGLTGLMFLLQIVNSIEMSFGMASCLLLLSEKEKEQKTALVRKVRLVRKNPLHELSEAQFKKEFRFRKTDIPLLVALLSWPLIMRTQHGVVFSSEICLLMVLYRFAFPSTMNKI